MKTTCVPIHTSVCLAGFLGFVTFQAGSAYAQSSENPHRAQERAADPDARAAVAEETDAHSQWTDPFVAQVNRARAKMQALQYREALTAWQTAYDLRQHPELLLEIARTQKKLGLAAESLASYRRFLTAHDNPTPEARQEAEAAIASMSVFAPSAVGGSMGSLPPSKPSMSIPLEGSASHAPFQIKTRSKHHGMIGAGWTLFSLGYGVAFGTGIGMGAIWAGSSNSSRTRYPSSAAGWTLLIPVLGPFVSGIVAPTTGGESWSAIWTVPWYLTDLPLQIVGVALIIQGYKTPQRVIVPAWVRNLRVHPYSTRSENGVVLSGLF